MSEPASHSVEIPYGATTFSARVDRAKWIET